MKIIIHKNKWNWGVSYTLITSNGLGELNFCYEYKAPELAYFGSLLVHESVRQKGIATFLHNKAISMAKELGFKKVQIKTEKERWMKDWYKRLGFKEDGDNKDMEGYVNMILIL